MSSKRVPFKATNVVAYCVICKRMLLFTSTSSYKGRGIIKNLLQSVVNFVPIYCSACTTRSTTTTSTNTEGEIEEKVVYRRTIMGRNLLMERDAYRVLDKVCGGLQIEDTNTLRIMNSTEFQDSFWDRCSAMVAIEVDIEEMVVNLKPYAYVDMLTGKD